jgi:glycosyltransferase involved in cell wall biosynthesis
VKIAITADPVVPVPPVLYGGIERVIDLLVRGLVDRGHDVTLFASAESRPGCPLVAYRASSSGMPAVLRNMGQVAATIARGHFDLVHSFGRLAYLAPLLPMRLPKLMTYQREITARSVAWGHRLSQGSLRFSAVSERMMQGVRHLGRWHLVYNGVPMATYQFEPVVSGDAPMVFLGRVEPIKGPDIAIDVALRSGRRLVIAGNIPSEHLAFFNDKVLPHVNGEQISYVGPVDDRQKNALLGSAAALLMPVRWDEPFGIVMAEALACGTPVLGLNRGAVPEVVKHGKTGFVVDTVDELVTCVQRLPEIGRANCRESAEALFSDHAVVEGYLAVYREMLQR